MVMMCQGRSTSLFQASQQWSMTLSWEDAVGEPVVAHELPDVLDRVQFRTFCRQSNDADVIGHDELSGHVPPSLVHQHDHVSARGDGGRYLCQVQCHGFGIVEGQHQPCALDVPRFVLLV